jgi:hypothetical protein
MYGLYWQSGEFIMNSLLAVFSMDLDYFYQAAPVSQVIFNIIYGVGWALLLGNLVFQAAKAMMSGLGFEADDPKVLFARTFVFMFLLVVSRQICEIGLSISATSAALLAIPSSITLPGLSFNMFGFGASWLLVIIMGVVLIFQLVKFFFQVGERYVILGVLTILSPLAFAMGGSRNTSEIFKGWVRMYGSMCLMMILNVVFVKLIISTITTFPYGLSAVPWLIFIIALTRVSRKMEQIIIRVGLNPGATGNELRSGMPGMLLMLVGRQIASNMINAKMSGGAAKQRASAPNGGFGGGGFNTSSRSSSASYTSGFGHGTHTATSPINTQANSNISSRTGMAGADISGYSQTTGHTQGQTTASSMQNQSGAKSTSANLAAAGKDTKPVESAKTSGTPYNPPIQRSGGQIPAGSHSAALHSNSNATLHPMSATAGTQGAKVQSGGQNVQNDTNSPTNMQNTHHSAQNPNAPIQKHSEPIPITIGNIGAQPPTPSAPPTPIAAQSGQGQNLKTPSPPVKTGNTNSKGSTTATSKNNPTGAKTAEPVKMSDKSATGNQRIEKPPQAQEPIDLNQRDGGNEVTEVADE